MFQGFEPLKKYNDTIIFLKVPTIQLINLFEAYYVGFIFLRKKH